MSDGPRKDRSITPEPAGEPAWMKGLNFLQRQQSPLRTQARFLRLTDTTQSIETIAQTLGIEPIVCQDYLEPVALIKS